MRIVKVQVNGLLAKTAGSKPEYPETKTLQTVRKSVPRVRDENSSPQPGGDRTLRPLTVVISSLGQSALGTGCLKQNRVENYETKKKILIIRWIMIEVCKQLS